MTRGPLSFKETDLLRALKTAIKAGLHVAGFEITKAGSIVVHAGKPDESGDEKSEDGQPKREIIL
jgi:hypothetical protein